MLTSGGTKHAAATTGPAKPTENIRGEDSAHAIGRNRLLGAMTTTWTPIGGPLKCFFTRYFKFWVMLRRAWELLSLKMLDGTVTRKP